MISARTRIIRNSLHVRKWHSVPERASCGTEYALGAKNRLLWYGSDIRYRKPPTLVRSRYSVRRTSSCGTRRVFRGSGHAAAPCVRNMRAVQKTSSCGTRRIFRGTRCADNYLLLIQEPEHPERDLIVEDVFSIVLDHIAIFDVFNLFLPFLSPANLKGLSVNLKI